jgi:hypothetical protein
MQLRVLVSSNDSGLNWDLRCRVREGLVSFVQRHYPQYLPRARADLAANWGTASGDLEHVTKGGAADRTGPGAQTGELDWMPKATPSPASSTAADTAADPVAKRGARGERDRSNEPSDGPRAPAGRTRIPDRTT